MHEQSMNQFKSPRPRDKLGHCILAGRATSSWWKWLPSHYTVISELDPNALPRGPGGQYTSKTANRLSSLHSSESQTKSRRVWHCLTTSATSEQLLNPRESDIAMKTPENPGFLQNAVPSSSTGYLGRLASRDIIFVGLEVVHYGGGRWSHQGGRRYVHFHITISCYQNHSKMSAMIRGWWLNIKDTVV